MPSTSVTHKFGGTSVADAERYGRVIDILMKRDEAGQLVVVSAMSGVTDALIRLATRAGKADPKWTEDFDALRARHLDTSKKLLGRAAKPHLAWLDEQFGKLHALLTSLQTLGPSRDGLEFVQGLGEVFSAKLLAAAFNARRQRTEYLDAREVLVAASTRGASSTPASASSSPASWRATPPAAPPRWAATARTTRAPSSERSATAQRFSSGRTSTACSRPIRGWCPRRCCCPRSRTPRPASWRTSAPR
jgi:aspartokinase/homoserine dehydrogenase 1